MKLNVERFAGREDDGEGLLMKVMDWINPEAIVVKFDADAAVYFEKRFFSASARRKDAKSGVAMSDGSFPIANAEDLANAPPGGVETGPSRASLEILRAR